MNNKISSLSEYPFFYLNKLLKKEKTPSKKIINLSIGEPKNIPPITALSILKTKENTLSQYPTMKGIDLLREAYCKYLERRFSLNEKPDPNLNVLPLNGTREGLFSFIQYIVNDKLKNPTVVMPNPVYKIYEGAAILAGAKPYYLNCTKQDNFKPDLISVSPKVWNNCQLLILCSPSNPTGHCMTYKELKFALDLAEKYNFMICSDECYTDIYPTKGRPPKSLVELAELSNVDKSRVAVFHSLSKRSSLAGLRSGFITSDISTIKNFHLYRTYHGIAMPLPSQYASTWAWENDDHVEETRKSYDIKYASALNQFQDNPEIKRPNGGFYFWIETPCDDELFTKNLYKKHGVIVLPGSYLGGKNKHPNPGKNFVRIAIVHDNKTVEIATQAINEMLNEYN